MPFTSSPWGLAVALLIAVFLISGSACTIVWKAQYSVWSVDIDGSLKQFRRPFFGVFAMYVGMSLVGVVDSCFRRVRGRSSSGAALAQPRASDEKEEGVVGAADDGFPGAGGAMPLRRKLLLVGAPAVCDMASAALSGFGLLFVPASVFQMLRGSSIFFAAILSMAMLGKRMRGFEWLGLAMCTGGVGLVGLSNLLNVHVPAAEDANLEEAALGTCLIVIGQALGAAQSILEEYLMKEVHLPPLTVVGLQGHLGLAIMFFFHLALWFLPGPDGGHLDDFRKAFVLIANSRVLVALVAGYVLAVSGLNASGIAVTKVLSGVHRQILDAMRTAMIWAFGLFVHYRVDGASGFGEVWTTYSRWALLGFFALICGQLVYSGVFRRISFPAQAKTEAPASPASRASTPSAAPDAPPAAVPV